MTCTGTVEDVAITIPEPVADCSIQVEISGLDMALNSSDTQIVRAYVSWRPHFEPRFERPWTPIDWYGS